MSQTTIAVAAGLVFHHGRLLIAQRRAGDHLGGLWEFPGGKREPGETFEDCLRRELREELGIEVLVGQRVACIEHSYPDRTVHLEFFRCRLQSGTPQPLGCADVAWITAAEISKYTFPPADAQLLTRLREDQEWWD